MPALQSETAEIEKIESDYKTFWTLASAYNAMTTSATDPVVLPSYFHPRDVVNVRGTLTHMYWDCVDNEQHAKKVMQKRIRDARQDIVQHLELHTKAWHEFTEIQKAISNNNRESVIDHALPLAVIIDSYTDVVKKHQEQQGRNAFLIYPAAIAGHVFYRKDVQEIKSLQWNPEVTYAGNERSLYALAKALIAFRHGMENISDVSLSHIPSNDIFGKHLEITKGLLERAGF